VVCGVPFRGVAWKNVTKTLRGAVLCNPEADSNFCPNHTQNRRLAAGLFRPKVLPTDFAKLSLAQISEVKFGHQESAHRYFLLSQRATWANVLP
jgi:hypothetical protein